MAQPPQRLELGLSVVVAPLPVDADGRWIVEVKSDVAGRRSATDPFFRVDTAFSAEYSVAAGPGGVTWDQAFYTAYANSSTMLHVWP